MEASSVEDVWGSARLLEEKCGLVGSLVETARIFPRLTWGFVYTQPAWTHPWDPWDPHDDPRERKAARKPEMNTLEYNPNYGELKATTKEYDQYAELLLKAATVSALSCVRHIQQTCMSEAVLVALSCALTGQQGTSRF